MFKLGGEFFAYLNHCPHMGGPACQGKMIAKVEEIIAAGPHQQGHDVLQVARCTWCARGTASSSTSAPAFTPAIRRRGCGTMKVAVADGDVIVTVPDAREHVPVMQESDISVSP